MSRHHCVVRRRGGRFRVHDLDSRHGTFVNDLPVREHRLEHSDVLTVGETRLLFLLDVPAEEPEGHAPEEFFARSTLEKKPGEAFWELPTAARRARDLRAVLALGGELQALRHSDLVAERLLDALFHVVPVERGIVLLNDPAGDTDGEDLRSAAVRDLRSGKAFWPSRRVTDRVVRDRVALLCEDIEQDEALRDADSVRAAQMVALLAVPLRGREDVLGMLYCDTSDREPRLTEHHLDLLTAMASIAALALENVLHLEWLRRLRRLEEVPRQHDLVGESPAMKRLFTFIAQVAKADATVLIRGESGTGKELTARAIHRAGPRADAPFLAINCATLTETLLESELFGHEKGAFTGAVARKIGKLEAADGGTLFLDEVGEIAPPLQAKLLRVLQEREFERVGGTKLVRVDVRILAATNRDLEAAMGDGNFREDLYYRLNVISVTLPPLRERRSDIPLLASHFSRQHSRRLQGAAVGFSPAARRALMAYAWPGNVRQLSNVIERALVLGQEEQIRPEDLPDEVLAGSDEPPSDFQATITETKKKLILDACRNAGGDLREAARGLGIHVNSLHRLLRNLDLKSQLTQLAPADGRR